jgi:hypothetical protein
MKSSSWTPTMHSFFTEYKDSLSPDTAEENDLVETGGTMKSVRRVSKPKHNCDS